jgi:Flp pilus assembly pilin Flp
VNRFAAWLDLRRDVRGQDLIEYAVIATFVSLLAIIGASALNAAVGTLYDSTSRKVGKGASFSTSGSATTSDCTPSHDDHATSPASSAPPDPSAHPDGAHAPACK